MVSSRAFAASFSALRLPPAPKGGGAAAARCNSPMTPRRAARCSDCPRKFVASWSASASVELHACDWNEFPPTLLKIAASNRRAIVTSVNRLQISCSANPLWRPSCYVRAWDPMHQRATAFMWQINRQFSRSVWLGIRCRRHRRRRGAGARGTRRVRHPNCTARCSSASRPKESSPTARRSPMRSRNPRPKKSCADTQRSRDRAGIFLGQFRRDELRHSGRRGERISDQRLARKSARTWTGCGPR